MVDSEYIVHMGLPTLGGVSGGHKVSNLVPHHQSQSSPSPFPVKGVHVIFASNNNSFLFFLFFSVDGGGKREGILCCIIDAANQ